MPKMSRAECALRDQYKGALSDEQEARTAYDVAARSLSHAKTRLSALRDVAKDAGIDLDREPTAGDDA